MKNIDEKRRESFRGIPLFEIFFGDTFTLAKRDRKSVV